MPPATVTFAGVLELAQQLTPLEKVWLVEHLIPDLEAPLATLSKGKPPLRPAYGICADLGTAPSPEEIDDLRNEIFGNFPRNHLVMI